MHLIISPGASEERGRGIQYAHWCVQNVCQGICLLGQCIPSELMRTFTYTLSHTHTLAFHTELTLVLHVVQKFTDLKPSLQRSVCNA